MSHFRNCVIPRSSWVETIGLLLHDSQCSVGFMVGWATLGLKASREVELLPCEWKFDDNKEQCPAASFKPSKEGISRWYFSNKRDCKLLCLFK